jgi:hypothetical protein
VSERTAAMTAAERKRASAHATVLLRQTASALAVAAPVRYRELLSAACERPLPLLETKDMLELATELDPYAREAREQYVPTRKVAQRYNTTIMSIERWLRNPEMDFPQPVYFGPRRFWRLSDLVRWEQGRERTG